MTLTPQQLQELDRLKAKAATLPLVSQERVSIDANIKKLEELRAKGGPPDAAAYPVPAATNSVLPSKALLATAAGGVTVGMPPYIDRTYQGDAPSQPTDADRSRLAGRADRLSGPWYMNRSGDPDTLVFHQDDSDNTDPTFLVRLFNGNWLVPSENFPIKKSYHAQIFKQPIDGKGANLFVPLEYDAWHAMGFNNQSIGIAFNLKTGSQLTQFQIETALQWTRYICGRFPINHVTTHAQVENSSRRSDVNANNFNLQTFIDACQQAVPGNGLGTPTRIITDCKPGSNCHSRKRPYGGSVPGAPRPYANYPKRSLNTAAIAAVNSAKKIPVFTGVADLLSFHPNVQYELTRRRIAQNTIHTNMPFVKLTSLMMVTGSNLAVETDKAWCPSIGIHGEMDTKFEDVYSPKDNRNVVGYAVKCADNGCGSVPLLVDNKTAAIDPAVSPPPGIVSVTTERNLAGGMAVRGGLFKANVKITANSVGQLNTLIKYFLRPSTMVMLEMGKLTSQEKSSEDVVPELPVDGIVPFNWYRPMEEVQRELIQAIGNPEDRSNFVQKYVYNNFGKYELFICYVANFKIKYTRGTYEIDLQVHSVQQLELATRHTGVRSTCTNSIGTPCKAIDVFEYFDDKYAWKENSFSALLAQASNAKTTIGKQWYNHIAQIRRSSPDIQNSETPDASGAPNGVGTGYYISWRFFVEKVLHDRTYGLLSVIQPDQVVSSNADDPNREGEREGDDVGKGVTYPLLHGQLISPIAPIENGVPNNNLTSRITVLTADPDKIDSPTTNANKLAAHEVGYHPSLRSTNPGVMLIYNPAAQASADQTLVNKVNQELKNQGYNTEPTDEIHTFLTKGEVKGFTNVSGPQNVPGTAFLTNGVWLNTNAIRTAFSQTTSVTEALNNLLNQMNNATEGYWNLQLVSNDPSSGQASGMHVIDMQSKFGNVPTLAGNSAAQRRDVLPKFSAEYSETSFVSKFPILAAYEKLGRTYTDNSSSVIYGPGGSIPDNGYLYMFNRRYRTLNDNDDGSELLDMNIDYSLPNSLYVQAIIGSGGASERGVLEVLNVDEINNLSLVKTQLRCPPVVDAMKTSTTPCRYDLPTDFRTVDVDSPSKVDRGAAGASAPGASSREGEGRSGDSAAGASVDQVAATARNDNFINTIQNFGQIGNALQLVEFNPAQMVRNLDRALDNNKLSTGRNISKKVVHPFNSSNLTKTNIELVLPGIAGIQMWQTFAVDKIPYITKQGTYVVTKLSHEFSLDRGWTTKITGRFRYLNREELINIGYLEAELNANL